MSCFAPLVRVVSRAAAAAADALLDALLLSSSEKLNALLEEDEGTRAQRIIWNDVVRDLWRAVDVITEISLKKTSENKELDRILSSSHALPAAGKARHVGDDTEL
jgi:hypothetical protein